MSYKPARLSVRTVAEFNEVLRQYLKRTGMSPTRLSALAIGDARFVGHVIKKRASRVSLEKVDKLLSFIEANPRGVAA